MIGLTTRSFRPSTTAAAIVAGTGHDRPEKKKAIRGSSLDSQWVKTAAGKAEKR